MPDPRVLVVGLDEPEISELRKRLGSQAIFHSVLPRIRLLEGELWVEKDRGAGFALVSKVIFHGIFEQDFDWLTALALWGGPCLPSAHGLMDCRLRLPCLARALRTTRFGRMRRGWLSGGQAVECAAPTVAKWGNWHCGENKSRFTGRYMAEEPTLLEPFIVGDAVRVMILGPHAWQIRLAGEGWLRSIHHPEAAFMDEDPELVADARELGERLGLQMLGVDYMVGMDGERHLLEVNHVPNVTVFPAVRSKFLDWAADWANQPVGFPGGAV